MEKIAKNTSFSQLLEISGVITRKEIMNNLEALLLLRVPAEREVADRLAEQRIRDLVSKIIDRLSEPKLVSCFDVLIKALRSEYSLVRTEAKRLLDKIDPFYLSCLFDQVLELENDTNWGVKRFAEDLVLKIANTWPILEKKRHYDLILQWQKSGDEKTVKIGNLLALQIMETWQVEVLHLYMSFLVECTNIEKNDFETSDLAATLAFKYLSIASDTERKNYLGYLTNFNECGHKELRRGFRTMALHTLSLVDPEVYSGYAIFLLKCLDGQNKADRDSAWEKLLKVDPAKLPVCELVYCQSSGLHRVRHAGRELAKKVSEDALLENLEEFLRLQEATCFGIRHLALELAVKISPKKRQTKIEVLEGYRDSTAPGASNLANWLLLTT